MVWFIYSVGFRLCFLFFLLSYPNIYYRTLKTKQLNLCIKLLFSFQTWPAGKVVSNILRKTGNDLLDCI